MNPDLENLIQAHNGDLAIRSAQARIQTLRKGLKAAAQELESANTHVVRLEKERKDLWREEKRTEESIRSYQTQRGNAVRALEQGVGSSDAAERQIEQCERILDELETTTLELMEQQEQLADTLAKAQAHAGATEAELAALKSATPEELDTLERSIREHTVQRDSALSNLDTPLRERYTVLVTRKGTALAPIRREACSACRRVVPAQQIVDMNLSRLQACRGCGRWLIFEELAN